MSPAPPRTSVFLACLLAACLAGPIVAQNAPAELDIPRIGVIDFYGLRQVRPALIQQALGAREGDPLPPSKGDAEQRINQIDRVVAAQLEAVCCEDGQTILYVGIEERGAPHFDLRQAPGGPELLPPEVINAYREFLDASRIAARRGSTAEDLTNGHALAADPDVRAIQQRFPELAETHLAELRQVIRESSDEQHRAAAVYILGYLPGKTAILDDLQFALRDADPAVRANAVHALTALAVLARLKPESMVRVSPVWFIEMLNSISWSDRNRATGALQILTDDRNQTVLEQLRARALDALVEMARWKTLRHALPAFILVGRVAGLPEEEIHNAWSRGDRESVIQAALAGR